MRLTVSNGARDYGAINRISRPAALLAALSLAVSACSGGDGYSSNAPNTDWQWHGNDQAERRYSELTQINAKNVGRLGLEWSLDLPGENSLAATPLEVRGVLYFSGGLSKVYAVDARSGKLLWEYDPQIGEVSPRNIRVLFSVNRGVAYDNNKVYVATKDGRMVALDAKTGKPLWTTQFLRPEDHAISTGAPRVLDGKVIIGNSGAEMGVRGYVTALDAASGKILWRFFTVPGNPAVDKDETTQIAAKTWAGTWWEHGGGGTPWNGITYDPDLKQVYIGTGNGSPYNAKYRCPHGEDNLFVSSVVALDADTGKYKWHYQYNPCEVWDWKATTDMVLSTLTINGQPRKVLMQAPSNGFFYVIDRTSGKLLSAEKIGKANWADRIDLATGRPVERPGIRYENAPAVIYPGAYGAHNWQATTYNPKTGLIYIPYMQLGVEYWRNDAKDLTDRPGQVTTRLGVSMGGAFDPKDPLEARGSLLAIDPVTQKLKWRVDHDTMWNGGLMSTAGDLVFQGASSGKLAAYDARDGKKVWEFDAKLGIIAPPITYAVGGKQYVSILVGPGGSTGENLLPEFAKQGWKYGLQPRRLLTFAIDGKASLPQTPAPQTSEQSVNVPNFRPNAAAAKAGQNLYDRNCTFCHGAGVVSSGGAPDLRASAAAADRATFDVIVKRGGLASNGMPKFDDFSAADLDALYAYVRQEAGKSTAPPAKAH